MQIETKENRALLALLAHGLFGRELHIDASEVDWAQVVAEANRHVVTAFLYPGMRRAGVPEEALRAVRSAALMAAARSDQMLHSQAEIVGCLRQRQIDCAVLKGFSAACCYPHPELRLPGDVDLLVGEAQMEAACRALEQSGYRRIHETAMHVSYLGRDAEFEIHRSASTFPENPRGNYARRYMEGALEALDWRTMGECAFPVLSLPHQLISLLAHVERHLAGEGIGLRQICDWAVTVHARRGEIAEAELAQLRQCGLFPFAQVLTRMGEKYLGLPPVAWAQGAREDAVDALMRDVFAMGNFHVHPKEQYLASTMIDRGGAAGESENLLRNYVRYVKRRARQEHPWAKSPLWIPLFGAFYPMRWCFRVLSGKRKRVNVSDVVKIARERDRMLRNLELYQ